MAWVSAGYYGTPKTSASHELDPQVYRSAALRLCSLNNPHKK
ncbi:TPA: hypothetical protein ACS783_003979 [Providencia alcalifaciens]